MAESGQPPPTGRARGRARGIPRNEDEIAKAILKPGELSAGAAASLASAGPGRGRGLSGDRGRGVSGDREPPQVAGGRAFHRGSITSPAPSVSSVTSPVSDLSSNISSSLRITRTSGDETSVSGVGGAGSLEPSMGRGATRGRRPPEFIRRTRAETLNSKKGSGGQDILLTSNYFPLISKPNWKLFQYRVDMAPLVDHNRVRKGLLAQHKAALPKYMFDGTMMFTTSRLNADDKPLVLNSMRDSDGVMIVITVKLVGEVHPTDPHYTQFFNIVLRQAMGQLQLEELRRNYYDPKAAVKLPQHKLEIWPGYVTSIRQHEEKMLLCCEVTCKVLRTDTVYDQIQEISRRIGGGGANYHRTVEKALLGAIVITRYNNKTYKIDEIAWDKSPMEEFETKEGGKMTLQKYYGQKYNKAINDPKQPLIISLPKLREQRAGQTGHIFLVPELCNMTGLSDEQRANFKLMLDLGQFTRQDPVKRTQVLKKFSERLGSTAQVKEDMQAWNLQLSKELLELRGRILDQEVILGGGASKATYKVDNADWGNCLRNWKQISVVNLDKWVVIMNSKDEEVTREFVQQIKKVAPTLGMTVKPPKFLVLNDSRVASYVQELEKAIKMGASLVMTVIPNNKGDHYSAIKKICYIQSPTPSQVMTSPVLNKPKGLMSVATKVALQMNCKLGGEPWAVKIPMKDTMVIGYDTYHDTLHKGKSVGAVVASLNSDLTKYLSVAHIHSTQQQELNDLMCPAISKALRKYAEMNQGTLPNRIIMYRDGVGDGQIPYIVDHEIVAIKKSLEIAYNGVQPRFTYIIVSKRINTRFFRMNGQPSNPPSGSVVDDVVTLPERYDFFLVSQSVRQGTVNPTSYNVIVDTSGLRPEHIQKLTYKMTHLYYNWPGTVRVPAPCQYAHKLAFLVGESLHAEPSDQMETQLYFL